jgi:hypothetical protein
MITTFGFPAAARAPDAKTRQQKTDNRIEITFMMEHAGPGGGLYPKTADRTSAFQRIPAIAPAGSHLAANS